MSCAKRVNLVMDQDHFSDCTVLSPGCDGGGGGYQIRNILILTLRRLMSYIYGAPILDVSRSHTTTQHSQ